MDLVRAAWRQAGKRATATPLYVVHRIDKDTSGLICFAKTRLAERALHHVFQRHTAARAYLAVAEGTCRRDADRVDAWSPIAATASAARPGTPGEGQHAVTHVEPLRQLRGARGRPPPTLCRVRLETGRTHQIRIHLAERGHPLVGETVYVRDLLRGRARRRSPRRGCMLHAALLGFAHPVTGAPIELRAAPPPDFVAVAHHPRGLPCRLRQSDPTVKSRARRRRRGDAIGGRPDRRAACRICPTAGTIRPSSSAPRRCWSSSGRDTSASGCSASRTSRTAEPALLVGNHSGGIPYDGAMLLYGLYRNHPRHRRVRPLVANFVFRAGWMANVIARIGGVRASTETALPLLAAGELVAVFPEGLKGVGKLYRERYRLARFGRGGFVRLARKAGVPLLPVAIVGAEEIHPVIAKVTRLAEPLGIPYIPITPTFPWLGPLGLLPVPDQVDDSDRRAHRSAGLRRRGRDDARRGGGSERDRRDDRGSSGATTIDSFRLKYGFFSHVISVRSYTIASYKERL